VRIPTCLSRVSVLETNDIRDVRAILDAEVPTHAGILHPREPFRYYVIHEEEPPGAHEETQAASGYDLRCGVVTQVYSGVHDSEREWPGQ